MKYFAPSQCPDSGYPVVAYYEKGKLTFKVDEYFVKQYPQTQEGYEVAEQFAQRYNKQRLMFKSVDDADEFLRGMGWDNCLEED